MPGPTVTAAPRNLQPLKDEQALRRSKAMRRDPLRKIGENIQTKRADAAAIAQQKENAAANAENRSIFEFYPVTLSAINSLKIHINSSTSNSANRQTWTTDKESLNTLYKEYYGDLYAKYRSPADTRVVVKPDFLAEKCYKFAFSIQPLFNDGISKSPVYMLKSLLEICTMLSELCIPYLNNATFKQYFQTLNMNAAQIKQQIKKSIDTNKCDETAVNYDEIKSNYNKPNSNGKLLAWYRRVEPNSPVWINNDINGKITIYSFNLNKWICAHPVYHKFAYDFVKINNVPIDMLFIIWPPATRSASQTNDLAAPQSPEKDTLVYLQQYFDSFNINLMLQENKGETTLIGYKKLTNKNLSTEEKTNRSIEFRKNVRLFIDILQTYGDEMKEIMDFLNRLNNGELYMDIEMTGIKFKTTGKQAHEKAGDTVSEPTYIQKNMQSDNKKKNTPEVFQNKQMIQKIYSKIIEKLKSLKDDQLRNPYPNFTSKNKHPLKTRYAEEAEQKSNESLQGQLPVHTQLPIASPPLDLELSPRSRNDASAVQPVHPSRSALNMAVVPGLATFQKPSVAATQMRNQLKQEKMRARLATQLKQFRIADQQTSHRRPTGQSTIDAAQQLQQQGLQPPIIPNRPPIIPNRLPIGSKPSGNLTMNNKRKKEQAAIAAQQQDWSRQLLAGQLLPPLKSVSVNPTNASAKAASTSASAQGLVPTGDNLAINPAGTGAAAVAALQPGPAAGPLPDPASTDTAAVAPPRLLATVAAAPAAAAAAAADQQQQQLASIARKNPIANAARAARAKGLSAAEIARAAADTLGPKVGGARKYPAKKYRFASRKHSKRCKTTSHKKACRRKSHKHRRITRKR